MCLSRFVACRVTFRYYNITSLYIFDSIAQITQKFGICSYIENIERNLPIGNHTFRVYYDTLKRLLAKICFDASSMCLFQFVAFRVTFNDLCCGLLSCIHLRKTDQSWHTGPNDSSLHFKVVFSHS